MKFSIAAARSTTNRWLLSARKASNPAISRHAVDWPAKGGAVCGAVNLCSPGKGAVFELEGCATRLIGRRDCFSNGAPGATWPRTRPASQECGPIASLPRQAASNMYRHLGGTLPEHGCTCSIQCRLDIPRNPYSLENPAVAHIRAKVERASQNCGSAKPESSASRNSNLKTRRCLTDERRQPDYCAITSRPVSLAPSDPRT